MLAALLLAGILAAPVGSALLFLPTRSRAEPLRGLAGDPPAGVDGRRDAVAGGALLRCAFPGSIGA